MKKYPVADMHCDVLSRLLVNPSLDFYNDERLDVTLEKLRQGGVVLQTFAIYMPQSLGRPKMEHIVDQLDIYNQRVVRAGVKPILNAEDITSLNNSHMVQPAGILSLEGADGLMGSLFYLELCYQRGVRLLGITWNYANWAADGILERRAGGFTPEGIELVKKCHELGIILDVSHLSEQGFWELTEMADEVDRPFIASHSNAYKICPNVRNLRDSQIEAIVKMDGRIGLTFVPWFVKSDGEASSSDLLRHIEHICSLGGERKIMFGSDFDGLETHLSDLRHAGQYSEWAELLLKHYSETLVRGWLYGHATTFLETWLPPSK